MYRMQALLLLPEDMIGLRQTKVALHNSVVELAMQKELHIQAFLKIKCHLPRQMLSELSRIVRQRLLRFHLLVVIVKH
jgi:hypothetical protein